LKNLLREAAGRLDTLREGAAAEILAPFDRLVAADSVAFWRHQEPALALFAAPGLCRSVAIPYPIAERLEVGERFVLRPLLPLLDRPTFYVLALSRNEVRLVEVRGQTVRRVDLAGVPGTLVEALGDQTTPQYLQGHSASSAAAPERPVVHGRGPAKEDEKSELLRYFRRVDAELAGHLRDKDAPVALAGVEYLLPIFRAASGLPGLVAEAIAGNSEHLSDAELARRARPCVQPSLDAARRHAAERFEALAGSGRVAQRIQEALGAARAGRVDVLFLSTAAERRAGPGDDDLLDLAACLTLTHGGTVYAVAPAEVPGGAELAAIFRY